MRSVYVGRGEIARIDAALNAMQQEDRKAERVRKQQEQGELEVLSPFETDIDALARLASTLIDVTLIAAGFHQHKRQWRKRRV